MSPSSSIRPRVVLDTDTYNEVDDQFALAHLLLSPDAVDLEAVYAAPFKNERSNGPADGMEKSFEEIHRVLQLVPTANPPKVYRGSTSFLSGPATPVESDAAHNLIERALSVKEGRLHVVAIAAITNIASALLIEPKIAERITVTWLGGHAPNWPDTREFNLEQDLHGTRVLLDREVPLLLLPCFPVASHLIVTAHELNHCLAPHGKLGAYLSKIVCDYIRQRGYSDTWEGGSKIIWDIAASAAAINPRWVVADQHPSPLLSDDLTWAPTPQNRRSIHVARQLDRDAIFIDFFSKVRQMR